MESWGIFFLGVIALASVVQAGFLIGLVVFGLRLARRMDELQLRLDKDITPALENFTRVSRAAAEISDLATLQARRLDLLLADTIEKIEETTGLIQQFVVRPLKPVGGILAFLKGLQRGMEVYLQLGGHAGRSAPRRTAAAAPPQPRRRRAPVSFSARLLVTRRAIVRSSRIRSSARSGWCRSQLLAAAGAQRDAAVAGLDRFDVAPAELDHSAERPLMQPGLDRVEAEGELAGAEADERGGPEPCRDHDDARAHAERRCPESQRRCERGHRLGARVVDDDAVVRPGEARRAERQDGEDDGQEQQQEAGGPPLAQEALPRLNSRFRRPPPLPPGSAAWIPSSAEASLCPGRSSTARRNMPWARAAKPPVL